MDNYAYNNIPISIRVNEAFERADELSKNSIMSNKSNSKINDSLNRANKENIHKLNHHKNTIQHNYFDMHFNAESAPNTDRNS